DAEVDLFAGGHVADDLQARPAERAALLQREVSLIREVNVLAQPPCMGADVQPADPAGEAIATRFYRHRGTVEPHLDARRPAQFRARRARVRHLPVVEGPRPLEQPPAPLPVGNAEL